MSIPSFDSLKNLRPEHGSHPREFENLTYVYPVLSRRSQGISIGINLNLDKHCNFDCPYCQVDRSVPKSKAKISLPKIEEELKKLLSQFNSQGVCEIMAFSSVPEKSKILHDLALSGDGEPTMVPEFSEVCLMMQQLQRSRPDLFFKLILITNSTLLDRANVLEGIGHLLLIRGEVWAKLDAGTEEWYQKVNISKVPLDRIEKNLIKLGESYPYKIQSLFCELDGVLPSQGELEAYLLRLERIKSKGSNILEVQLHTLARKPSQPACTPVSKEFLESLQVQIQNNIGIPAIIYGVES